MPFVVALHGSFKELAEFADHALNVALFYLGLGGVKLVQVDHLHYDLLQVLRQELGIGWVCRNAGGQ